MPKKRLILLIVAAILLAQCQRKNNYSLSERNLQSEFFDVPVNKDTVIRTSKGAIITIPDGAFSSGTATHVKLEIKEAYTLADMVQGGLTTKAGKELLSSGGMIYINPADNSNITIIKPISISIPTKNLQDAMKLYKGEKKPDGTIDWINPEPLPKPELSEHLQKGQLLFNTNCASCHNPVKNATGPALAFLDKRRDWRWLEHFVYNSSQMIANGDLFANCIYKAYNKTVMTAFPTLTSDDLHAIFDYTDIAAGNIAPVSIPDFKKSLDSCIRYEKLKSELENKRNSSIIDHGKFITIDTFNPKSVGPENGPLPKPENLVGRTGNVTDNNAVYYKVTIQTFGWYNVDILMANLPGFENSELTVRITGEYKEEVTLFLLLPAQKTFLRGGHLVDKTDEYGFYTDDGKIPLPQNSKALLLAMREYEGQLYFYKTEFTTSPKQSLSIQLAVTTKEKMNADIEKLNIEDFTLNTTDSKNATSIRKIDLKLSEVEKQKPQNCDCNCEQTDTASWTEQSPLH